MTGQYAHNHGVLSNQPPDGGYTRFDNTTALPVWLQAAGYRTIHIGKFLNGYGNSDPTEVPPGWSDWQALIQLEYYDYDLNDNGLVTHYDSAAEDYSTDVLVARAEEAIAESAPGGPFFLNLSVYAPHMTKVEGLTTAVPAARHDGLYAEERLPKPPSFNESNLTDKPAHIQALKKVKGPPLTKIITRYRDQLESLLAADEAVGRVIDALRMSGELDNTVVMFLSDNGFFHGQHRIRSLKEQPYEEAIHVPLLVRGPGFTAGTTVNALASNIDLAPTIAAIAGATPLVTVDGIDLRALPGERSVMIETYTDDEVCFTGLRTETETYVRYVSGEEELYDLTTDPYQLSSLHARPAWAKRLDELRAELDTIEPEVLPACEAS